MLMSHARTAPRTSYVGRFAPSPTGPLHFGSLLAALASYLDARAHQGRWQVRIEDLDPPREVPGAADLILHALDAFGLYWDGPVTYQSHHSERYDHTIHTLLEQGQAYYCGCSRQDIQQRTGSSALVYDGYCRNRQFSAAQQSPVAVRVQVDSEAISFVDQLQGPQIQCLDQRCGDFVIRRKDGFYAYQLAVVCDDEAEGISHIVRGSDLLSSTPRQLHLQHLLGFRQPCYAHIPIMLNDQGQKLSKQTFASALDTANPVPSLLQALTLLGQQPRAELHTASTTELLDWAISHWSLAKVPQQQDFAFDTLAPFGTRTPGTRTQTPGDH